MLRIGGLAAALLLCAPAGAASGQDVEMLGERYGTPVPAGYQRSMIDDPGAFQFRRAWEARGVRRVALAPGRGLARVELGPRSGPVVGDFAIPVLLGLYSNSGGVPPFSRDTIQEEYFGAGEGTIADYYSEVSRGLVTLAGDAQAWVTTARPDTAYTVGESGLVSGSPGGGGAGSFVYELVGLQTGLDWGLYDNDGPDGQPNSGDDDGFVDVLAVIHPTRGGECGGAGGADRIWSHRWSLTFAVGTPFVTTTPRTGGGNIMVDDYTIQAAISCSGGDLNQIGVFTHELGHAFGLPDLYDTCDVGSVLSPCPDDVSHSSGAGIWDLMSSGNWGCDNNSADIPCHMGAWSKDMLGWLDVVTLAPDLDHGTVTLPPVETTGMAFRIDANDGSGEYFLIENRQRLGYYDQNLYAEGLLIWQIDEDWVSGRWSQNRVNANEHLGVWLRQADGNDHLGRGIGRGDAGDPFPGQTGNAAFHAATIPTPVSYLGGFTGITIFDIARQGDDMRLSVATRLSTLTVRADGASGTDGLFTVNGASVDPPATTFTSAPFTLNTIEAVAGETLQPGERRPWLEWIDDPGAPRSRSVVTPVGDAEYVARYGGNQYEVAVTTTGGVAGVMPGSLVSTPPSPDLWFDAGTSVTLEAIPQVGFDFVGWTGDLAGETNPAAFTATAPLSAGADFDLIYGVLPAVEQLPAATALDIQLETMNGTAPFRWVLVGGALPEGLDLSVGGRITGAATEIGDFLLTLEATDALGLPATGVLTLQLSEPELAIEALASPFLLTGPELTQAQVNFLNRQGNRVAPYDIGDFRAWVLSHPELPMAADVSRLMQGRIVVPMRPATKEGPR